MLGLRPGASAGNPAPTGGNGICPGKRGKGCMLPTGPIGIGIVIGIGIGTGTGIGPSPLSKPGGTYIGNPGGADRGGGGASTAVGVGTGCSSHGSNGFPVLRSIASMSLSGAISRGDPPGT